MKELSGKTSDRIRKGEIPEEALFPGRPADAEPYVKVERGKAPRTGEHEATQ